MSDIDKILVQAEDLEIEAPESHVDSSAYLEPFEVTPEVENFLKEFNLEEDVEIVGDAGAQKMGKVKQSTAEELARTENLFKSGHVAEERLEGMEEAIKGMVKKLGEEVAPGFEFETDVTYRESNYGNPAYFYDVKISKGSAEMEMQILYYTFEPGIGLQEGASSWDWAAWLGLPESPFYDEDFLTFYDEDQASIGLTEMFATFKESQDYWDIKKAIKDLQDNYSPEFHYMINMDERGEFRADVRDESGNTVYEIGNDEEGNVPEIEDGFMRHTTDTEGLERHLKQLGIMPKKSHLVKGD